MQQSITPIILKNSSGAGVKGLHLLSLCDVRSERAQKLEREAEKIRLEREHVLREFSSIDIRIQAQKSLFDIDDFSHRLWEQYQDVIRELHKGFLKKQWVIENLTTTVGRTVLARRLSGNNVYSGNVNYTALGSDPTAAVVANTKLGTEVYRKGLSSGTFLNNVAYIETFFTASEVTGTFEEYGNFIDGTGVADSGQLFNRFTQTITKSNVETLNVQSIVTFSDV